MSLWTKIRDYATLRTTEHMLSRAVPHQHAADRRAANEAAAQQIELYKQQKASLEAEAKRLQDEKDANTKKTNEKQIKNLRRSYRAPGSQEDMQSGYSDTLG